MLTDLDTWIDPFLAELQLLTRGDTSRGVYDHVVGDRLGLDQVESAAVGSELTRRALTRYESGTQILLLSHSGEISH